MNVCARCKKDYQGKSKKYCGQLCYWEDKKGKQPKNMLGLNRSGGKRGRKMPASFGIYMKNYFKGRNITWGAKISKSLKGKPLSMDARIALSASHQKVSLKNWAGFSNKRAYDTLEYSNWRKAIFKRDDYTCQICGRRGSRLEADHKVPWAISKDKRFNLANGLTLCFDCHKIKTFVIDWKFFNKSHLYRNDIKVI